MLHSGVKTSSPEIPSQWAWHYRALLRLGHQLAGEVGERFEAVRAGGERGGTDSGDDASDESEHETLVAEIRQERTELAEVEAALARIRLGTYGVCERSGVAIEPERLRALPWTRYSAAEAARRERESRRQPRGA